MNNIRKRSSYKRYRKTRRSGVRVTGGGYGSRGLQSRSCGSRGYGPDSYSGYGRYDRYDDYRRSSVPGNYGSSNGGGRSQRGRARYGGSSGIYGNYGRRIFNTIAWSASLVMVLNMLPPGNPVSDRIDELAENLPAFNLNFEELKNGPDTESVSVDVSSVEEAAGGSETNVDGNSAENTADTLSEGADSALSTGSENNGNEVNTDGTEVDANPDNAGEAGNDAVDNTGNVSVLNGISFVASDGSNFLTMDNESDVSSLEFIQNGGPEKGETSNFGNIVLTSLNSGDTAVSSEIQIVESSIVPNISDSRGSGNIIIYHTHATEAYQPVAAETTHTENLSGTVREGGNNLAQALTDKGFNVIHDTTLHDSPSYNKSYNRSLETIKSLLSQYPDPKLVIDFHRDAASSAGGKAKTVVIDGQTVSSFCLVVGTQNDNYQTLRSLAEKIVNTANEMYPGFATGIVEKPYKFNEYTSDSYILLELGNNENTISQVNGAAVYLADVLTNALQ